jgi:hypothetical protein
MPYDLGADIPRLYEAAQKAPSVFNNQPWRFRYRLRDDRIELWLPAMRENVDRARAREYVISCGAALFNLRLAIRVAGHDLVLWLLPVPSAADFKHPQDRLLARVEIVTGRTKKPALWEQELYEAIWRRHTNRWPYFAPAPLPIITAMQDAAAKEGAWLRLLHPRDARRWTRREAEVASLLAPPFPNRVSDANYGPRPTNLHRPVTRQDFWRDDIELPFEHKPQLLALSTDDDQPVDWLRAGQALERAILTATRYSVSAPDSSVWAPDGSESAPYGLAAKYNAPQQYGLPARHHRRHDNVAHYGLSVSPLTPPLEYDDETGERRRWQRRSLLARGADRYRARRWSPELPQMLLRVGYAAVPVADERRQPRPNVWSQLPEQPPGRTPAPPDPEAAI